jgi:hypothetical protein
MYAELEVVPGFQHFSTASYVETIPETTINCLVRYQKIVTVLEVNDKEVRGHFKGDHSLAQYPEEKIHEKCHDLELAVSQEYFRVYPSKRSFYPHFSKVSDVEVTASQKDQALTMITKVTQNNLKTDFYKTTIITLMGDRRPM